DAAVAVGPLDDLLLAEGPGRERWVDPEPLGEGVRRLAAALVLAEDGHGDIVGREAAVDVHRVAQAELLGLVDAVDGNGSDLVEVGVEAAVEEEAIGALAHRLGEAAPAARTAGIAEVVVESRQQLHRLVEPADVAVHDAPERVFGDLKVEPR